MPHDQLVMQVWVGRLAMMGFLTSIIEEAITKKGTLGQVGFITPSPPLFYTIVGAATAATISATAVTLSNAATGKMTARQVAKPVAYYCYCTLYVAWSQQMQTMFIARGTRGRC